MMASMRDKFRGCLVGALLGDCLGSPFEGLTDGCISRGQIEDLIGTNSKKLATAKDESYPYTDDSAMARSICKSLLSNKCFNGADLAARFLEDYDRQSDRGYGAGMKTIFDKWRENRTMDDPFLPAKEQFSGSGSYGNGAAMRVAPVALFGKEEADTIKLAKETALLTHSNNNGYNGAILQALAVHKVLFANTEINKPAFLSSLKQTMQEIEGLGQSQQPKKDSDAPTGEEQSGVRFSRRDAFSFTAQLEKMESLVLKERRANDPETIIRLLGNDISAQEAVPAAIFSFVQCLDLNFVETLLFTYTLGGDTDTIGTMAGALAGAHFGFSSIPKEWKRVCEGLDDAVSFADQFHDFMTTQ